ncbi:hypothetical protein [Parasphingorhabdus sp.]|uniref:hypothetical protein n=1 Tax=Parasphingorhabdus sp. TaxID=2709688 RepID=UPI003D28C7A9
MSRRRSLFLVGTFLVILAGFWYFCGVERNYYAVSSNRGSVEIGSKFDIRIGQDYTSADRTLKADEFKFGYQKDNKFVYRETSWRRGYIEITVEDDAVTKIRWRYDFMAI